MRFGPRWRQKSLVSPVAGSVSASMRSGQSSCVMSQETALGRAGGGRRRFRSRYALDEGYEAAYETVV